MWTKKTRFQKNAKKTRFGGKTVSTRTRSGIYGIIIILVHFDISIENTAISIIHIVHSNIGHGVVLLLPLSLVTLLTQCVIMLYTV